MPRSHTARSGHDDIPDVMNGRVIGVKYRWAHPGTNRRTCRTRASGAV